MNVLLLLLKQVAKRRWSYSKTNTRSKRPAKYDDFDTNFVRNIRATPLNTGKISQNTARRTRRIIWNSSYSDSEPETFELEPKRLTPAVRIVRQNRIEVKRTPNSSTADPASKWDRNEPINVQQHGVKEWPIDMGQRPLFVRTELRGNTSVTLNTGAPSSKSGKGFCKEARSSRINANLRSHALRTKRPWQRRMWGNF